MATRHFVCRCFLMKAYKILLMTHRMPWMHFRALCWASILQSCVTQILLLPDMPCCISGSQCCVLQSNTIAYLLSQVKEFQDPQTRTHEATACFADDTFPHDDHAKPTQHAHSNWKRKIILHKQLIHPCDAASSCDKVAAVNFLKMPAMLQLIQWYCLMQ